MDSSKIISMLTYMVKKYKKKRTYRRRRRQARPRKSLPLSGFPSKKLVKLRYVDTGLILDAGVGLIAQDIYRANSVFDPYQPAGGHQPMGFDQWALIYNKYTVISAKMTMKYATLSVTNLTPGRFGILLSSVTAGTTDFTSINSLLESKLTGMNVKQCGAFTYGTQRQPQVSKSFNAKRFFGKKDVVDGSANSALVNTNPGNEAYFIPWVSAVNNTQNPGAMNFDIYIDYVVQFSDPKTLDGS